MIASLDPGIRGCGVALFGRMGFVEGSPEWRLVACAYVRSAIRRGDDADAILAMARACVAWVGTNAGASLTGFAFEIPQIYLDSHKTKRTDNNDLIPLAAVGGAVALGLGVPATRYRPAEWKGQMSEQATTARVESRIAETEIERLTYAAGIATGGKSFGHNVTDAVGVGLKHVGRFEPRRVIAR